MEFPYLKDKKILFGVSSGIAIYKAVDLVSKLRKLDCKLDIVMTNEALKMVSDVVFSSVGNCPVYTDVYKIESGWIPHTELSREADVLIIAPATANIIAKIANGICDDLLSTTALAFNKAHKIIIPAMNVRMFEATPTLRNLKTLEKDGWFIMTPDSGHMACGEVGQGRYPDNDNILEFLEYVLAPKDLKGKKVLVSAGPTSEPIDPVRSITNKSSGKMGYEIAKEFSYRGAEVTLVSGPVNLKKPVLINKIIDVHTAQQMHDEILNISEQQDIIIMAAAVSDYRVENASDIKIKKKETLELKLIKNPDILSEIAARKKPNQYIVGFAAETNDVIGYARKKLEEKKPDMIIANDVSRKDIGFNSNDNEVYIITKEGEENINLTSKRNIAVSIVDHILNNISG